MKRFVKFLLDVLEFVCKVYTYFTPVIYIMFAILAVFVSYYMGFNNLIGGVILSANVVHIILSSIFIAQANDAWDLEMEPVLVNGVVIYFVVGFCVWVSPMTITDWMSFVYIVNGLALMSNAALNK